jgi:hypothetical protein
MLNLLVSAKSFDQRLGLARGCYVRGNLFERLFRRRESLKNFGPFPQRDSLKLKRQKFTDVTA